MTQKDQLREERFRMLDIIDKAPDGIGIDCGDETLDWLSSLLSQQKEEQGLEFDKRIKELEKGIPKGEEGDPFWRGYALSLVELEDDLKKLNK